MKRQNLTAIIQKVQELTAEDIFSLITSRQELIRKAAVNEIIRLEAATENVNEKVEYLKGFSDGYNSGFECAEIAARSIITAQQRFDEIDQEPTAPAQDLADTSAGVPGHISIDIFGEIGKTLENIPGSGYEFLKRSK